MGKNAAAGIGLALIGTLSSAVGYTLQKIAHRRAAAAAAAAHAAAAAGVTAAATPVALPPDAAAALAAASLTAASRPTSPASSSSSAVSVQPAGARPRRGFWVYWQFSAGLGALVVGSIFSVVTMGMAGQAELAPMAATTMMWNMVLAWRVLKEPFGRVDAAALGLMCAGTTVALLFGAKANASYDVDGVLSLLARPIAWLYAVAAGTAVAAAAAVVGFLGRRPPADLDRLQAGADAFGRAWVGGMLGGFTGFAVKATVEMVVSAVGAGNLASLARVEVVAIVVSVPLFLTNQVRYMNSGLARYESSRVIPVYQSTLVFSGVAGGYLLWDELAVQTPTSLALFAVGCGLTMAGMLVLMWKPRTAAPQYAYTEVDDDGEGLPRRGDDELAGGGGGDGGDGGDAVVVVELAAAPALRPGSPHADAVLRRASSFAAVDAMAPGGHRRDRGVSAFVSGMGDDRPAGSGRRHTSPRVLQPPTHAPLACSTAVPVAAAAGDGVDGGGGTSPPHQRAV